MFFDLFFHKHVFTMWFITITAAFLLCVLNVWSIATLRGEIIIMRASRRAARDRTSDLGPLSLAEKMFRKRNNPQGIISVWGGLSARLVAAPDQTASVPGVWVDDPLDSKDDGILFDIHYFRDIASVVKDTKIASVVNEKYVDVVDPLKSRPDQVPILESRDQTVSTDSNNKKIVIHEWEKMRESDL